jgi:hypothetical protein
MNTKVCGMIFEPVGEQVELDFMLQRSLGCTTGVTQMQWHYINYSEKIHDAYCSPCYSQTEIPAIYTSTK